VGYFTEEAIRNIARWLNGEISGARAFKNIIDISASMGGGLAGCSAGSAAGGYVGPWGSVVGCAVGSVFGSLASSALSDHVTATIFNIPKEEALENAYRFFKLPPDASNEAINQRYRTLSKVYHPDKEGGSHEKFLHLNACLEIIRISREQASVRPKPCGKSSASPSLA